MIIKTNILSCSHCGSKNLVKNGFDSNNGKQLYKCKDCNGYGRENPQHSKYSDEEKKLIIGCYLEGMSMCGIERKFGVCRQTLASWLKAEAKQIDFQDTLVDPHENEVIEVDEMWSFVFSSVFKVWVWVAIARHNRQIIAFVIGDRSKESCKKLWKRIPYSYRGKRSFSDFWESYKHIFDPNLHKCVGKETGETNHVERLFCTVRQWLQRVSRKTLAFSKVLYMHHVVFKVFFVAYNRYVSVET